MSNRNYNKYSRRPGRKREIIATEEMKKLVPTSRIYINAEGDTIYIYNGNGKRPVTGPIGDLFTKVLKEKLTAEGIKETAVVKWIGLLSDELLKLEESDLEDDQQEKIRYYIQKYSKDIPPVESILIGGIKPMFQQVIDGKAVLLEEIQLPDSNIILRPLDNISYLTKAYPFDDESEINSYIKRAQKETLDSLYTKVKSIFRKYADRDDFHIVICAADIIFTYFQDKLGMTHYLLFVGDNDVGKTNDLKVFQWIGYRPLFDISITEANIYRTNGSIEEGQGIILEDEIDDIDRYDGKYVKMLNFKPEPKIKYAINHVGTYYPPRQDSLEQVK